MSSIVNWFRWPCGTRAAEAHNRRAQQGTLCVGLTLAAAVWMWSRVIDPLPSSSPTTLLHTTGLGSPLARSALALFQLFVIIADVVIQPAPKEGEKEKDRWNSIGTFPGHACYFTVQTLLLQTVYFFFSALAAISGDMRLAAVVNSLALWTCMQGVMLTLLFLKLNWFENQWRTVLRPMMEAELPGWSDLMLFTHIPALVLGLVDLFFIQKSSTMARFGPALLTLVVICIVYGILVTVWMFFLYERDGTLLYPFIAKLTRFPQRVMFVVVQGGGCCVMMVVLDVLRKYVGDSYLF